MDETENIEQLKENIRRLHQEQQWDQAWRVCLQLLSHTQLDADSYILSAIIAHIRGDGIQSLALLQEAKTAYPTNDEVYYILGNAYSQFQQSESAIVAYQQCLRLNPQHDDAMWNLSELLRMQNQFALCVQLLERLLEKNRAKDFPSIHHRLAVCYGNLNRVEESLKHFELELEQPLLAGITYWEMAHVLLGNGFYGRGWDAYSRRFEVAKLINVHTQPFDYPFWQGENLNNKVLLVHGEQGLGDEIMFASMVPEILEQGARVVLAVAPSLVRVMQYSFSKKYGGQIVVLPHEALTIPVDLSSVSWSIDCHAPIGHLPMYLRREAADYARCQFPYLYADNEKVTHYQKQLHQRRGFAGALEESRNKHEPILKVGLMWGSNPAQWDTKASGRSAKKTIAVQMLEDLACVGEKGQIEFISLQNGDVGAQAGLAPNLSMHDFSSDLIDFSDTAALMQVCDLVISVDTSVVHMAGALERPTWLLLMKQADWRWLHHGEKSVWYPSVRLFRQKQQGNWYDVVHQVRDSLQQLLEQHLNNKKD